MNENFKSFKEDLERAYALWILNNMDLVRGYVRVKYTILMYLKWGLYCLTLPFRFIKLLVQNIRKRL
jgi:hypothetical protein